MGLRFPLALVPVGFNSPIKFTIFVYIYYKLVASCGFCWLVSCFLLASPSCIKSHVKIRFDVCVMFVLP